MAGTELTWRITGVVEQILSELRWERGARRLLARPRSLYPCQGSFALEHRLCTRSTIR